jgi:hypothetical protein
MSVEAEIHRVLAEVLRAAAAGRPGCRGKKRIVIAEELSARVGVKVTESMLNDLCGTTKTNLRFPLSWARAICEITGNDKLAFEAMRDELRESAELGTVVRQLLQRWAEKERKRGK